MLARVLSSSHRLFTAAVIAASLLAVALPAAASAQTYGPADSPEELQGQTMQYLKEFQRKVPMLGEQCAGALKPYLERSGSTPEACQRDADACAESLYVDGCTRLYTACQAVPACEALLPPQPDGDRFEFTTNWAQWLTSYFRFAGNGSQRSFGDLWWTTNAAGFALLALFLTFGVIHYWASGMLNIGSGGTEMLAAPLRAIFAGFAILTWPEVVDAFETLCREAVAFLIGGYAQNTGGALAALDRLHSSAEAFKPIVPGPDIPLLPGLSDLIAFLLSLAIALTTLALSASKLALDFSALLLCVGMPLAVAIWVLPGMSWLASSVIRAYIAIMFVPIGWALTLVTFAPIADELTDYAADGSFEDSLAGPLVGIMLLLMLFAVMRQILHWGRVVPSGSRPLGAAWGAVMGAGFMGLQAAGFGFRGAGAVKRGIFPKGGGGSGQRKSSGSRGAARTGTVRAQATRTDRGPSGAKPQAGPTGGGKPQGGLPSAPPRPPSPRDWSLPAKGDVNLEGKPVKGADWGGTPTVNSERANMEFQASRHRLAEHGAPSRETLEGARSSLPIHHQRWLRNASVVQPGKELRPERELARMAASPNMEPQHRDAFRTLLDGAHASNRNDFMRVASQNPDKSGS
jgi:hypothetical protein